MRKFNETWFKQVFDSVNGNPSAKRFFGGLCVVVGLGLSVAKCFCGCDVPTELILGIITLGLGAIGVGVVEKKHHKPENINDNTEQI